MKYSKLSHYKIKKILQCFANELTATQTSKMLGLNRHTINRYYQIFRENIADYQEKNINKLSGEIEIDESYFGSRHKGDKRGRSLEKKIPVDRFYYYLKESEFTFNNRNLDIFKELTKIIFN